MHTKTALGIARDTNPTLKREGSRRGGRHHCKKEITDYIFNICVITQCDNVYTFIRDPPNVVSLSEVLS